MLPLERVIAHFLPALFPGMKIEERAFFRVTRDADFEVSDEADDLLEALQTELRRRPFGEVVRLEVSESMSDTMLAQLKEGLQIDDDQISHLAAADFIFCRNVFIYFSESAIGRVARTFARFIRPPGYLFIGAAESLLRLTTDFNLTEVGDAFVYAKRERTV